MSDHPSLHDPHYYEPYDYEDRMEPQKPTIDDMIREHGGAFIYNPYNSNEIILFEYDKDIYWVEAFKIIERGELLKVRYISVIDADEYLDEIVSNYPEWSHQEVYGKNLLEENS